MGLIFIYNIMWSTDMLGALKKLKNALYTLYLGALLLAFNAPRVCLCVVVAILLHEGGHTLALLLWRKPFRGFELSTQGAKMGYGGLLSYREELFVCLCGPLSNLLVALFTLLLFRGRGEGALLFAYVNLFYARSNLLPFPAYDGERILRICLSFLLGAPRGERAIYVIGFFLRTVLLFLSLYLIFYFDAAYQIFGCIFLSFLSDFSK